MTKQMAEPTREQVEYFIDDATAEPWEQDAIEMLKALLARAEKAEAERDAAVAEVLEAQKALVDCGAVITMAGEGDFVDHRYLCDGTLHQLNLANTALAAAPEDAANG